MTTIEYLVNQKLNLLQLAEELKNIQKACALMGVSRKHYYDTKKRFNKYGVNGLKPKTRSRPVMPNQTEAHIEAMVINYSLENPAYGKDRIANDLRIKKYIYITSSTVGRILKRNKINNKYLRFAILEEKLKDSIFQLNKEQIEQIITHKEALNISHVMSYFPGYLLCQDTFEVGHLKGIGKIYMQVVVDTYGSFAFAKLYTAKTALTSVDMLINKVLPFYIAMNIPVLNILTDNGSEYKAEYDFLLELGNIEHRRTKVACPKTNGFVERFNRTVFEEFFCAALRKKWYSSLYQLQYDLDKYLLEYNFYRSHQGYRVKGQTPAKVLLDNLHKQKCLTN